MAVLTPAPRIGKTTGAMPTRPVRKPAGKRKPLKQKPAALQVTPGLINR